MVHGSLPELVGCFGHKNKNKNSNHTKHDKANDNNTFNIDKSKNKNRNKNSSTKGSEETVIRSQHPTTKMSFRAVRLTASSEAVPNETPTVDLDPGTHSITPYERPSPPQSHGQLAIAPAASNIQGTKLTAAPCLQVCDSVLFWRQVHPAGSSSIVERKLCQQCQIETRHKYMVYIGLEVVCPML